MVKVRVWCVGSVALAGALLWAAPAKAAEAGKMYYGQYCAKCHGASGKGDGPQAATLQTKVPDLTQLAKKNGGKFPYMDVLDILDGASPLPSHGGKEMPVWGQTFQSDGSADPMQQAAVRGQLMLLTDYLRSIQVK
jgi:mono/diheme cytochrome c family protein